MQAYTITRIIIQEGEPDVTTATGLGYGDALRRYNAQRNAYLKAPGRIYQELGSQPITEHGSAACFFNGRVTIMLMFYPDEVQA